MAKRLLHRKRPLHSLVHVVVIKLSIYLSVNVGEATALKKINFSVRLLKVSSASFVLLDLKYKIM